MINQLLPLEVTRWRQTLDAIPKHLMMRAYDNVYHDYFVELTKPIPGDEVYVCPCDQVGSVDAVETPYYVINVRNETRRMLEDDIELERDTLYPDCEHVWLMDNPSDEHWILTHLQTVSQFGFRIFKDRQHHHVFLGLDETSSPSSAWEWLYQALH